MISEEIASRIMAERKRQGMTRLQLAVAAGIHPNTVQRIESANRVPTVDTLIRIAHVLDLSWKELVE